MKNNFRTILLTALACLGFINTTSAQWIETTITMPPQASARDLIYNPNSNKVYTANTPQTGNIGQNSVTIIDGGGFVA